MTDSSHTPDATNLPKPGTGLDAATPEHADLITAAKRRVAEDPSNAEARIALARLYLECGDAALAVEQLDAGLERAPDHLDLLVERARALAVEGRLVDAEQELRKARRLDPDRGGIQSQLGIVLFKRGLYRQAEIELNRAIQLDDRNGAAYFYRGEALNQLNQLDEALEMLERAVQYQPKNAKAYYTMGILYDRKHLLQEAATMYRKARDVGAA